MKYIPYGKQYIDSNDLRVVKKALKNNFITAGKQVEKFEKFFSKTVGSKFAVSCSNATCGLLLSYLALGVKKNDILVMPAVNFVASINMAKFLSAKIFLTDVDPNTGHMRAEDLKSCIKKNKIKKIHTVILMHNGGLPANIFEIKKIQKNFRFNIIEDACHALGAKYTNKSTDKVGNSKYSNLSVFSFHPVKNITTGEGGMITTNSQRLYDKLKILRNHGIIRKKNKFNKYNWDYKINEPGFNFRLNDFQCALGINQLKKLNKFVKQRKLIAKSYIKNFFPFRHLINCPDLVQCKLSAFHLFIINLKTNKLRITKNKLIQKLFKVGIYTQVHYIPIFKFPLYKGLYKKNFFKNTIKYFKSSLSIPIFYKLKKNEIQFVSNQIKKNLII